MVKNNIRDMQAKKVFARFILKTLSFSCLASLYLLCSAQANDSTANLLHLHIIFLEEFAKGKLVKSLFMIGVCQGCQTRGP